MNPQQFKNLQEAASNIVNEKHKKGHDDEDVNDDSGSDAGDDEASNGHQEIKHKGKSCKEVHPDMDHEEWEMSQNESVELDELGRGTLDRYREKSKKQISDIEKSRKKKGEPVSSKYKKRLKGRRQATIRLSKKAMEDVELDEGRSFFKLTPDNYKKKAKTVLDKKHKVKTKGGGTETVSRDDLEAAGDVYDRLNAARKKAKGESVDYELQDSTKETLGRFIADSVGND